MHLAFHATWSEFWTKWVLWGSDEASPAQWWLQTASNQENRLCARLLIRHTLGEAFQ